MCWIVFESHLMHCQFPRIQFIEFLTPLNQLCFIELLVCLDSGTEQICQVPPLLPQVLLLVPGEIHQVPQQERLHHGVCS